MAFNGSGVFLRLYSWTNDALAGIKIRADRMDNEMNGMATGLSTCITKNGQTTITANLPMAGFKHTGVDAASSRTDYAQAEQLVDGVTNWAIAGGTADALTATFPISTTTLKDGQEFNVRATAANATTTPTFSPDGLTARNITAKGGAVLAAGDIKTNSELILRYNLANTRYELVNRGGMANDVTSTSNITDNAVVRGDGGAKGVQTSGVLIDDSNNITGAATLVVGTTALTGGVAEVYKSETTAYNSGATDGQLSAGSTLLVNNPSGDDAAVSQIVLGQRTASGGFTRIVATGGSTQSLKTVVGNTEIWNEAATNSDLATRIQVGAPTAAGSPAVGDVNAKRFLIDGVVLNSSAMVLLSTGTASASANLAITANINSTYTKYIIEISDLTFSAATQNLLMEWSTNAGSSYIATGYVGRAFYVGSDGTNSDVSPTTAFRLNDNTNTITNTASYLANATVVLPNPSLTGYKQYHSFFNYAKSATVSSFVTAGGYNNSTTAAVNAVRFAPNSGTFSGTFKLYGVS
jgi:hypothetical protein